MKSFLPTPLLLLLLLFSRIVRRRARHDGYCAVTSSRNAAESLPKKDIPVHVHCDPFDSHHFGGVSGDNQQRAFVLGSAVVVGGGAGAGTGIVLYRYS